MKIFYIGGVKSGKSRLAQQKALELSGESPPVYLATSEVTDAQMQERIERHREERQDRFQTVEEPVKLLESIQSSQGVVLIECLSLWLNNMLYYGKSETEIFDAVDAVLDAERDLVMVMNDVSSGVHAESHLGRKFADLSGLVAQRVAAASDEVYHCIAGIGHRIK